MSGNMRELSCCDCGVEFAISTGCEAHWKKTEKTFYCPNGHGQMFKSVPHEEEIAALKKKIGKLESELAEHKKHIETLKAELEVWKPRSGS